MRYLIVPFVGIASFLTYELVQLLANLHDHLGVVA